MSWVSSDQREKLGNIYLRFALTGSSIEKCADNATFLPFFANIDKSWWEIHSFPIDFLDHEKLLYIFTICGEILVLDILTIWGKYIRSNLQDITCVLRRHTSERKRGYDQIDRTTSKCRETLLCIQENNLDRIRFEMFESFIAITIEFTGSQVSSFSFLRNKCSRHRTLTTTELYYRLRRGAPLDVFQHPLYKKWWWRKPIADIFPKNKPCSGQWTREYPPHSSPENKPNMRYL